MEEVCSPERPPSVKALRCVCEFQVVWHWDNQIREKAIRTNDYEALCKICSALKGLMNYEIRSNLIQAELTCSNYRLVGFIARFDDSIAGSYADRQEARADHSDIQISCIIIFGKSI